MAIKSKELVISGQTLKHGNYSVQSPMQMQAMAKVLRGHIEQQKLFTNIGSNSYAHVEGWQFAGGLMGIFPKVKTVTNLSAGTEKKWLAEVEIIEMKSGKVVGFGVGLCSNLESKKKSFDEYAVLSMAQTRAIGKAYRNLIGWVMKLAGYEGTPKEEMVKMGGQTVHEASAQRTNTEVDLFTKAKTLIEKESNQKILMSWKAKIENSDIYTVAQKHQLMKLIDSKLTK